MSVRQATIGLTVLSVTALLCGTAGGQQNAAVPARAFYRVPGIFQQQFAALGNRVKTIGKENTTYTGQVFDAAGNASPARVVYQLPGLVWLEGFKGSGSALSFDGKAASGITSQKSDESLLETFVMDFAEGMLESVQESAAVRVIGRGFGPDPRVQPDYKGIRYDIYDVTGPVRCRQDRQLRSKLYYFDSSTGLLQSTRYYDRSQSPPVKVETRFSLWGRIDGSAYPARIDRYEDGKLVFTFIAENIVGGAAVDVANFR